LAGRGRGYSSSVFRRRKTITPSNTAAIAAHTMRTVFESIIEFSLFLAVLVLVSAGY
jgi:hypothetical protein